jgi:hypothetical protein
MVLVRKGATMPDTSSGRRVLDPNERIAEVLFGLIMVLTFTGSLSIAEAGRAEVRSMLIGALGCNVAWGVIDAVFYLMGALAARGQGLQTYRLVRATTDAAQGQRLIAGTLPPLVASVLQPEDLERVRQRLLALPDAPPTARLQRSEWLGALAVFLLVFLSTFPVTIPFIVMREPTTALRVSNGIAIAMLFIAGVGYARAVGRSPWRVGLGMVVLGGVLVALTVALGG